MQDPREQEGRDEAVEPEPYVPPMAEDIDTAQSPTETAAGPTVCVLPGGVDDSGRWH